MNFPYDAYCLAFIAAFLTSLIAVPAWRLWSLRVGLVDDPGHRKIHHTPVPLAGGLAVATGLILPLAAGIAALKLGWLGAYTAEPLTYGLSRRFGQLAVILIGALAILMLGYLDDRIELRPRTKFLGQFLVALAVATAGVRITLFIPSVLFSYAVTVLWILTVINAFNFMDNMNGLCAGLGTISAWCFGWSAAVQGQYLVAALSFSICGALAGFLPFNYPRASIFLGDAGSHLVGYLLAVLAILPHFFSSRNQTMFAVLTPLLILIVPLLDMAWVVALRWGMGRPFYEGDTNHLSHRLVRRGWSRSLAVAVIWLFAAVFGAIAMMFGS